MNLNDIMIDTAYGYMTPMQMADEMTTLAVSTGMSSRYEAMMVPLSKLRNEPCVCGSGRKLKKCCFRKLQRQLQGEKVSVITNKKDKYR